MAEPNFVLFKRDDQDPDSHEDVWDDTALIQAYDRAVNLVKEKVVAQMELKEAQASTTVTDALGNGEETPSTSTKNWKIGDFVRSVYSEDGVVYEAIIKKIKQSNSSCLIKYLGYDNEEEVLLKDLKPSAGPAARNQQIVAAGDASVSDDMECEAPFESPSKSAAATSGLNWQPVKPESFPSFPGMGHISSIPPPPPPTAWPTPGSTEMDSDSLYSMLMSWYMAGYHTGYYQGAQQRNKRKGAGDGPS